MTPTPTRSHPAVRKLLSAAEPPGAWPSIAIIEGVQVLSYTATRFTLGRRLVEMLPPDGILLHRIAPKAGKAFWVAMTRREFEQAFAETIRTSLSWEFGYYTSGKLPLPAERFVVP